jgi:hypothetical protein
VRSVMFHVTGEYVYMELRVTFKKLVINLLFLQQQGCTTDQQTANEMARHVTYIQSFQILNCRIKACVEMLHKGLCYFVSAHCQELCSLMEIYGES